MNYRIVATPDFISELKRLVRKHVSLVNDLALLFDDLETNPQQGTSLGNNCYKIRLAITSKGQGKSGGARIITYIAIVRETKFLVGIYDKSEQETMPDKEIKERLKNIL